jgi:hypothetical protein
MRTKKKAPNKVIKKAAMKKAKVVKKSKTIKAKSKTPKKEEMKYNGPVYTCKVCGEAIHPKRAELGYKDTCVKHSTAERFTAAISTINMEGDTEISIIRDPKVAEELEQLHYIYQYR